MVYTTNRLARDNDPQDRIDQDPGDAAGQQGQDQSQPEPECADPEELAQSAAYAGNNPIMFGAPQRSGCLITHFLFLRSELISNIQ